MNIIELINKFEEYSSNIDKGMLNDELTSFQRSNLNLKEKGEVAKKKVYKELNSFNPKIDGKGIIIDVFEDKKCFLPKQYASFFKKKSNLLLVQIHLIEANEYLFSKYKCIRHKDDKFIINLYSNNYKNKNNLKKGEIYNFVGEFPKIVWFEPGAYSRPYMPYSNIEFHFNNFHNNKDRSQFYKMDLIEIS